MNRQLDIVERKLSHLTILVITTSPYNFMASIELPKGERFSAPGTSAGDAVEHLYSYMLRHYDRLETANAKEKEMAT